MGNFNFMWVILILLIVFGCLILSDIILPLVGIIIGVGLLYLLIAILIGIYKSKKQIKIKRGFSKNTEGTTVVPTASGKLTNSITTKSSSIIEKSKQTQIFPIKLEVKGIWDDERTKIKRGFDIENILIDGIRHRIAIIDDLSESEYAMAKLMKSNYPFSWSRLVKSEIRGMSC